jgi:hypothetical protein
MQDTRDTIRIRLNIYTQINQSYTTPIIHHQLFDGGVFRTIGTHSVHSWAGYPLKNAMTASRCPKFAETPCDYFSWNTLPPPVGKFCSKNPPPNSLNLNDSRLLLPINRHHCHNPAPGLQVKLKAGMALHQSNDQFTRSFNNPARNVDERKPNRLHPPGDPETTQDQTLHDRVEVHRQDHDPPPGSILPKIPRRQLPPGKIPFHYRVRLLRLAATFPMPMDQPLPIPKLRMQDQLLLSPRDVQRLIRLETLIAE